MVWVLAQRVRRSVDICADSVAPRDILESLPWIRSRLTVTLRLNMNRWDGELNLNLPPTQFLYGIHAVHDNGVRPTGTALDLLLWCCTFHSLFLTRRLLWRRKRTVSWNSLGAMWAVARDGDCATGESAMHVLRDTLKEPTIISNLVALATQDISPQGQGLQHAPPVGRALSRHHQQRQGAQDAHLASSRRAREGQLVTHAVAGHIQRRAHRLVQRAVPVTTRGQEQDRAPHVEPGLRPRQGRRVAPRVDRESMRDQGLERVQRAVPVTTRGQERHLAPSVGVELRPRQDRRVAPRVDPEALRPTQGRQAARVSFMPVGLFSVTGLRKQKVLFPRVAPVTSIVSRALGWIAACSLGAAQSASGQTLCISCLAGTYADTTGLAACKSCAQGSFSAGSDAASCTGLYAPFLWETGCVSYFSSLQKIMGRLNEWVI